MQLQQLNQIWYEEPTINFLIKLASKSVGPNGKVALVSCPTLYKRFKEKMGEGGEGKFFDKKKNFLINVLF